MANQYFSTQDYGTPINLGGYYFKERPFRESGDATAYIIKLKMAVEDASYQPLKVGTRFQPGTAKQRADMELRNRAFYYYIDEEIGRDADILQFWRCYAAVPPKQLEFESTVADLPGLSGTVSTTSTISVLGASYPWTHTGGRMIIDLNGSGSHGATVGMNCVITMSSEVEVTRGYITTKPYRKGDVVTQNSLVYESNQTVKKGATYEGAVVAVNGSEVTVALSSASTFSPSDAGNPHPQPEETNATLSFRAYDLFTRSPLSLATGCTVVTDYIRAESPADIPLAKALLPAKHSSGVETTTLSSSTEPTAAQYMALIRGQNQITINNGELRRWRGDIYAHTYRTIKAQ